MAKLTRKTAKIFGETASTSGSDPAIGQFGSAKAGTYVGTGDIATIQSLSAWSNGWIDAVTPTHQFPTLPEMTGVHKVLSYQEAYLLQEGIPEYDSGTTYYTDSICKAKNASNELVIYRSKVDNNTNHAVTDTAYWEVYLSNMANKDLSNLTSVGNARLHALKSYSDEGEALTDSEGLADIINYAHSTFDSSKFTAIGTPVITDNGIVSGFSDTSYLTFDTTVPTYTTFDLYLGEYTIPSLPASGSRYWLYNCADNYAGFEMSIESSGKLRYFLGSGDSNWDIAYSGIGTITYAIGQKVKFWLNFDGSKYTLYSSVNGGAWAEDWHENSALKALFPQTTKISEGTVNYFPGTVDLKYIKSIFDGVTVFNGCRTGIDTIKSNDYTEGGTPTISTDGVASGFSTSNYITKTNAVTISSTGEFHIDFKFNSTQYTDNQYIFDLYKTSSDEIVLRCNANANNYNCLVFVGGTAILNQSVTTSSDIITGFVEYKNGTYTFDINGYQQTLTSSTVLSAQSYDVSLGARLYSGSAVQPLINGSIDLNSFKIYIDGDLIYQPCLKIPYTESSTGSKVVDNYYIGRLADMYQQFGYSPYYSLDEENGTFKLPFGELYGLIGNAGNNFSKPDYSSGVSITAPYTAEESGCIGAQCEYFSDSAYLTCKINGVDVCRFQINGAWATTSGASMYLIPIRKGDVFTTEYTPTAYSQVTLKFFKNKGV